MRHRNLNSNCCGDHCRNSTGEVRVYPLGGSANLFLCFSCWLYENDYRRRKGLRYNRPEDWPLLDWNTAEVYSEAWPTKRRQ
jgi:hypothetical protein